MLNPHHNLKPFADRIKIERQVRVTPALTADDWQLYTRLDCSKPVNALNTTLKKAFEAGLSRREVQALMWATMDTYSNYGAYDTEPRGVLEAILNAAFGTPQ